MNWFRWSKLYPRPWRNEFGDEFDAMMEQVPISPKSVSDILAHALEERVRRSGWFISAIPACLLIGWLNVVAIEVQWPAGALLVTCAVATATRPRALWKITVGFAATIPLSNLYLYQIPHIHHEPIINTIVDLVPAFAGSCVGFVIALGLGGPKPVPNPRVE
jgi:hypothetical protein